MQKFFATWIRRLWPLALLCACAASPPQGVDASPDQAGYLPDLVEALKNQPPEMNLPDPVTPEDTLLFRQAAQLDRLMKEQASDEEALTLKKECGKQRRKNPFCPIVREAKKLMAFWQENERPYRFKQATPLTPVAPELTDGTVSNYGKLQRTDVDNLLPAFKTLPPETLALVKTKVLAYNGCPDNAAIALAATLEDGMPNQVDAKEIAAIYAKVGACHAKRSNHRENFLTRAGLLWFYAGEYAAAEKVLAKVEAQDALVGRPSYWLYRARKALGDKTGAEKTLKRLWSQHGLSFHALMAAIENGQDPETLLLRASTVVKKRSRKVAWVNSWLGNIEILKRYGFLATSERLTLWVSAKAKRLEPEVRLYLSEFGSPFFKVTRLTEMFIRRPGLMSKESFKLAYPLAYWPLMERNGKDLDPLLLLAVGRKESKFDPKAISPANAQGLLQIHPNTAKRLTNAEVLDLTNPFINISFGAHYLSELLRRMEGSLLWTLAAYNAGEAAVQSWKARFPHPDPILQMDLITYRETRNYVGFVLSNYFWYRRLYQPDKPHPLESLVPPALAQK